MHKENSGIRLKRHHQSIWLTLKVMHCKLDILMFHNLLDETKRVDAK